MKDHTLSNRQRELLILIALGHSSKSAAVQLGIAMSTVKTHRQELMRRLGIRDVAGLVRRAVAEGLVDVVVTP